MKKPGIPSVQLDVPTNIRLVLLALKENVEIFRGLRGGAVITPLAATASNADIIRSVNEIIAVLQGEL